MGMDHAAAAAADEQPGQVAEILALCHQLLVLHRQLGSDRVRFTRADRASLAALLHQLLRDVLSARQAGASLGAARPARIAGVSGAWRHRQTGTTAEIIAPLPTSKGVHPA